MQSNPEVKPRPPAGKACTAALVALDWGGGGGWCGELKRASQAVLEGLWGHSERFWPTGLFG